MSDQVSSEQLSKLRSAMERLQQMDGGATSGKFSRAMDIITSEEEGFTEEEDKVLGRGTYLRVDKDEMAAWLYLTPPDKTLDYKKQDLIDYLRRKGVTTGLHQSNLSAMIKKMVYNREILVARGVPEKQGRDGYFEFLFTPDEYGEPRIREDGSVDYTYMSSLHNVKAGDKIAVYHHAEQGVNGCTVLGNAIKAKLYRDLPPMHGKGFSRDKDIYYAQTDGKIEVKNGKIDIRSTHEIFEDVTMIIGKVDFFGDVVIHGNVEDGVVLRAGRNIEVQGSVAGATLYAGGDVILSRGISGGYKASIAAKGSVYADFIEHTTVEAGGTVQANTILNSTVYSGDKVIATGKRGAIIGGYTHGLKGVEATNSSNDVEVKTVLHCGYEAASFDRLVEVRKLESEIRNMIEELVDAMAAALRDKRLRGSNLSAETESKLLEWDKLKDDLFVDLDKIEKEKVELEALIEQSKGAEIKIDGNVYRGTVICVNAGQIVLDRDTKFMKYTMKKGVIESSVIV